jgi:hypothetical protein
MTAAVELLARCRAAGVELGAGSGGTVLWEADGDSPPDLLAGLAANKAALLAMIRGPSERGNRSPPCRNERKVAIRSWETSSASESGQVGALRQSPRFRPTCSFPRLARAVETNFSTGTTVRA